MLLMSSLRTSIALSPKGATRVVPHNLSERAPHLLIAQRMPSSSSRCGALPRPGPPLQSDLAFRGIRGNPGVCSLRGSNPSPFRYGTACALVATLHDQHAAMQRSEDLSRDTIGFSSAMACAAAQRHHQCPHSISTLPAGSSPCRPGSIGRATDTPERVRLRASRARVQGAPPDCRERVLKAHSSTELGAAPPSRTAVIAVNCGWC